MLIFDADLHTYSIDGKIIPSVSQLIHRPEEFIFSHKKIQEGIDNHTVIERYLKEGVVDFEYSEIVEKFSEELEAVKKQFGEIVSIEQPYWIDYKGMLYAGTPDIVLENAIVDIKYSIAHIKYYALQLAAYSILTGKEKNKNYIIIAVNGKAKAKNIYNDQAKAIFIKHLEKYYLTKDIENYYKLGG